MLSRSVGHDVVLALPDGRRIRVVVAEADGRTTRLGSEAPPDFVIHRAEVQAEVDAEVDGSS